MSIRTSIHEFLVPWFAGTPRERCASRPSRKIGRHRTPRSLRFESLEGRQMMSAAPVTPALEQLSLPSTTSVRMAWADVAGESGYRLDYKVDGTNVWQQGATAGQNVTSGTISNLAPGVKYDFAVQAYNNLGSSPLSNQLALTLPALANSVNAPTNVGAAFNTMANQTQVSWSPVAGATSYSVYRSTMNNVNTAVSIGSVGAGATSTVDSSPAVGAEYFYWIKAVRGSASSGFSNAAASLDTDHNAIITTSLNLNSLLNAFNLTQDLVNDLNDLLAWDPAPKLDVSARLDFLSASVTENLLETPFNQIVSGTSRITLSESGEVTAQVVGGISAGISAAFGLTLHESITVGMTETYSASAHSWVVNPSATLVTGSLSAAASGAVTVLGLTSGMIVSTPGVSFSAAGSGQITVAPRLSVHFAYELDGFTHTIWQSPALSLPPKTFNLQAIVIS